MIPAIKGVEAPFILQESCSFRKFTPSLENGVMPQRISMFGGFCQKLLQSFEFSSLIRNGTEMQRHFSVRGLPGSAAVLKNTALFSVGVAQKLHQDAGNGNGQKQTQHSAELAANKQCQDHHQWV